MGVPICTGITLWPYYEKEEFVTVAKAYSGITDEELKEIDRYVRKNITGKFGPVHGVRPGIVFEVAFEGAVHRGGTSQVALRFPRIQRWRKDKEPVMLIHWKI